MTKNPTIYDINISSDDNNPIGELSKLTTTAKDNLVDAINEVNAKQGGSGTCTCQAATDAEIDAMF